MIFCWKKSKKTWTFSQKSPDHLLLMTSYLVTIEIDHYWTWLKMHARDERTATEKNQVLMFYPLGENSEKTFGGSIHNLPPPLYVRGLNDTISPLTLEITSPQVYETSVTLNHYPTDDHTLKTIISQLPVKDFTCKLTHQQWGHRRLLQMNK